MRGNFTTDRAGVMNPNYKHGLRDSRLFRIWSNMKTRCYNSNSAPYQHYGARGITVCDEWLDDFMNFYNWAMSNGYSDDLTIDRIDNDGNYEPSNCRWVNSKVQGNNRRSNHEITINDMTKTIEEWSSDYGINRRTVYDRIRRGWNEIDAITQPVQTKFRRKSGDVEDVVLRF